MYLYYDDEPDPARSATAEIWLTCLRRAAWWTALYAAFAALVIVAGALGCLDYHLTVR